ncbi:hypothetical protein HGRIS_003085 [Hohenbuehelia grisea]|uniref:Phospholipid/glycerol acyltransferase domain-containing protein n=1 Tax=Hohenbuehelia grisea TaxID=104357 RepID=A0ABR3JMF4_9AGAR
MSDVKVLHRVIRRLASWSVWSFFTEIHVIGEENVPKDGPIVVCATHHNMMLDPAVLSVAFPYARILNYWSKASLFANPVLKYVLLSSGNIPVDRKSKDRQVLFKGTFEALSKGSAVALFPEGTSYTEPRIMQVKDGAAWSALEYAKWLQSHPDVPQDDVVIVPVSIVYTNKSKYRSSVVMEFGTPITMKDYKEQFFSEVEGASRAAVKRLTRAIETELIQTTINAPDWDTLYAARMARDLLWEGDNTINLDDFVIISQTLVDLFATPASKLNTTAVKRNLLEYYSLLQSTHLTNNELSGLPLPRSLDPKRPTPLPGRLRTLAFLISDTLRALVILPFFVFPLIVHTPVYVVGRLGARLVEDEEETQAQNKVIFGLLFLLLAYPSAFFFLWALFMYTPVGALLAASTVYLLIIYHNTMINGYYQNARRLVAAWRVLVGVWAPKRLEFPTTVLSQYTTPIVPPVNPWVDRPKVPVPSAADLQPSEPPVATRPKRRAPSRRIMRHLLRARVEAVRALAGFFDQLERGGSNKSVRASVHLAHRFRGWVDDVKAEASTDAASDPTAAAPAPESVGWRNPAEVISFLRKRGAKIPSSGVHVEGEWAALSSDPEVEDGTPVEEKDEMVWVPSSVKE